MAAEGWIPVSRSHPCPICEGTDNCKVSTEGKAVWCGRIASERQNRGGQYLHWLGDDNTWKQRIDTLPKPRIGIRSEKEFASVDKFDQLGKQNYHHLRYWCERYCVPEKHWLEIHAFAQNNRLITPEFDDRGEKVVGVVRRELQKDGSMWKGSGTGHKRGITFAKYPNGSGHLVLIVEGASDTAAANAAGFEAMGRHTRDADLLVFADLLSDVPDTMPIVVMVENDSPPARLLDQYNEVTWRQHIIAETLSRVAPLVERLGRPVLVSTPPQHHNDFCDWWKSDTEQFGHMISEPQRREIGQSMAGKLLSAAIEAAPTPGRVRRFKQHDYDRLEERMFWVAETRRLESLERGEGIDADYQSADSCSFSKSFHREKAEERKIQYMFGFLSCRSWRCWACKERKLKPGWTMHLAVAWLDEDTIYRTEVCKREFAYLKRRLENREAEFAAIWLTEDNAVIYSTIPVDDRSKFYPLEKFCYVYGNLIRKLESDVFAVDAQKSRPITTSKKWTQTDSVRLIDVLWKLTRIGEIAEKNVQKLFVAKMQKDDAENLISEIKAKNKKFPVKKTNFFAVDCEDSVLLLCSHSSKKLEKHDPEDAVQQLKVVVAGLGDEWKPLIRTSPGWAPRRTKQWRPLECDASPEDAREAAKQVKVSVTDLDSDITFGPFVDKALIQFTLSDPRESEFLSRIDAKEKFEEEF